jgi:phenylacetate-CoA ligase
MTGKFRLQLIDLSRGTTILPFLEELERHQYLPEQELELIRNRRLENLFTKAKNSTAYYAKYNSFEDVPILTKDIIRENTPGLISSVYKKKLHKKQSGGSTGIPLVYYTTSESQSYLWAGIILSWQTADYKFGDKVAFIAGSSLIKTGIAHKIFYKLFNIDTYPVTPLNEAVIASTINSIKNKKTKIIYGYANVINELADYIKTKGPGYLPHLKGIVCTAEILKDSARTNIETSFGVKVVNQYGCNEGGTSAFECENGKLHLISSKIVYRVNKENGCIISTDLANEGFIMLNYDTGDILEFEENNKQCDCGRTFPVIKRVTGRSSDIVTDRYNNRLHDSFFYFLFKYEASVKKYQAVYNEDVITVTLKTDNSKKPEEYSKYMDTLKEQVKFKEYRLLLNEPFILLKNGKHKQIVDNRACNAPVSEKNL